MVYEGTNNGEGLQDTQLDVDVLRPQGYAIINPGDALSAGAYSVSINSGDLNASDTLTVGTAGDEALFDGSTVSLSGATNIGIGGVNTDAQGNEQFRFDVIYLDSSGEVQKTEGVVDTLSDLEKDNNLTRFERNSNPIPTPGTWPSPIIAAVVINSSDSSVTTAQLRDYRVPASLNANTVDANTVDANTVDANTVDANTVDTNEIQNKDYNEGVDSIADASGTTDIDFSVANMHEVECDGDVTISFSNITSTPAGNSLLLRLYDNDGTGPHTISYPSAVEWDGGNVENEVPSNGDLLISFVTFDGGTTIKAMLAGEAFA